MLWMFPWNIRAAHLSVNDYHFKPMGHTFTQAYRGRNSARGTLCHPGLLYLSAVPSIQVQVCRCAFSEKA